MNDVEWYRPTGLEIAAGYLPGHVPGCAQPPSTRTARIAFESVVREALQRPPCAVAFSGGRDSSAVLAVAVDIARRDGLPLPLAVVVRYGEDPAAGEDTWQDLVLDHLSLEPVVLVGATDKDALGPVARRFLRQHGVLWPAFLHDKQAMLDLARGGTLLTGDGGDEVLGPQRITNVRLAVARGKLDRRALGAVRFALAPPAVRRRMLRQAGWGSREWLTPEADRAFTEQLYDDVLAEPLHWRSAVRRHPRARSTALGVQNLRILGGLSEVAVHHPFLDERFVEAFAAGGTWLGPSGRTESMRRLFADLLPDPVLARTSKATFNASAFGPGAREFVRDWDGSGAPSGLVDVEALRRLWAAESPPAGTFTLLQHLWWTTAGHRRS